MPRGDFGDRAVRHKIQLSRRIKNTAAIMLLILLSVLALVPLFHIVAVVFINGFKVVAKVGILKFLTATPNPLNSTDPGGIGPALLGTAMLVALSSVFSIALALPSGVFVAEFRSAGISRTTMLLMLLLMEFPTILVGLTVYAILVKRYGYSMFAGAVALAIVVLPYMAVHVSEALRHVTRDLREAAFSLGASRLKTVYRVIIPIARRGIATGILIGIAKAAGETAPLLFTIGGYFKSYVFSLNAPGGAVSLLIYDYIQKPQPGYHELAWGAALVLLVIVFGIMLVTRMFVKEVRL